MSVPVAELPDDVTAARPWLAQVRPGVPAPLALPSSSQAIIAATGLIPGRLVPPRARP